MMTAKEFWLNKFPDLEKDWGKTGHDDNFQVRMMEEYAKYYHEQVKKCDLADVGELCDHDYKPLGCGFDKVCVKCDKKVSIE